MITMLELGWLAGLLEGEGWFGLKRNGRDITIEVASVDKDVIDRAASILSCGFHRYQKILPSGKTDYRLRILQQSLGAGLMMTLLPLMSARRAARIIQCLDAWKAKRLRQSLWTHCKNGHELSGDNLKITHEGKYEKRRCRECGKLRMRKHRSKQDFICA